MLEMYCLFLGTHKNSEIYLRNEQARYINKCHEKHMKKVIKIIVLTIM